MDMDTRERRLSTFTKEVSIFLHDLREVDESVILSDEELGQLTRHIARLKTYSEELVYTIEKLEELRDARAVAAQPAWAQEEATVA